MWIVGHSQQLNLDYLYDQEFFRFEDGVNYSFPEAVHLSRERDEDIVCIHTIKRMFGGHAIPENVIRNKKGRD